MMAKQLVQKAYVIVGALVLMSSTLVAMGPATPAGAAFTYQAKHAGGQRHQYARVNAPGDAATSATLAR